MGGNPVGPRNEVAERMRRTGDLTPQMEVRHAYGAT
jgi:hypothetical protein